MMTTDFRRPTARLLLGLLFLTSGAVGAAESAPVTLTAPKEVSAGAEFQVSYSGPTGETDFVSIDKPGAPEHEYGAYAYTKGGNPVKLRAPDVPGNFELRCHRSTAGYPVAGSAPLTVADVKASVEAPATVNAGASLEVSFSGPNGTNDFVSIDKAGAADRDYGVYAYTKAGSPAKLRAPDTAGAHEVRYHLGQTYRVIASSPLNIAGTGATLEAPANASAGSEVKVSWTGPNQANDFISIDKAGAGDRDYGAYAYTKDGSPVAIRVPEDAGSYTFRYHTGQTYSVLAQRPIQIDPATAMLSGPAKVEARAKFEVAWTGPDNAEDYIELTTTKATGQQSQSYAYTKRGNPARLQAPQEAGTFELRYVTGQKRNILARAPIEVTPGSTPGRLRVTTQKTDVTVGAVELILDASGSMLQRLGGKRRIDLAKGALVELTKEVLPAETPFALRVFGHRQASACQTDLEIALAPLDRGAAVKKIQTIEAKNLAKTPIGESLLRVKDDLAGTKGSAVVVLVTDGEETCDGNPREAIKAVRSAGFDVRVNIVGFAVDELALKEEFENWARLGGGNYFDAGDGAALARAFRASLRLPYSVVKDGAVTATGVVNGDALALLPGRYQIQVLSSPPQLLGEVEIAADKDATVEVK